MNQLKHNDSTRTNPSCMHWTKNEIFKRFDKIAEGKGFGHDVAQIIQKKNVNAAETSNARMQSEYHLGLGNVMEMPAATSYNTIEQCRQYIDYYKYNIQTW
ncbi:hypothetical protein LIER_40003 [Lithospermum erythrorhizon]|uniref:Uncharacterized protein n=1 Tax=Lithospermum erythrorhizon TaxID=34254 RepID=A0AAV3QSC9_LITER